MSPLLVEPWQVRGPKDGDTFVDRCRPTFTFATGNLLMRSTRDKWSFSKLDEILDSMAESRIQQEDVAARADPSDTEPSDTVPSDTVPSDTVPSDTVPSDTVPSDTVPVSQHSVGINVPDPPVCQSASVEPAREEVDAAAEDPRGASRAEVSVESKETDADTCKDNVDDTFDRVACRLIKVRRGAVRRRRWKWIAIGLLIVILVSSASIGGLAIWQQPKDPLAWIREQTQSLIDQLNKSLDADENPGNNERPDHNESVGDQS